MTPTVLSALTRLDRELVPIRLVAERLAGADSVIDPATGAVLISHRPRIGTEAYACVIFPGVEPEVVTRYEEIQRSIGSDGFEIPTAYRNVLSRLNGAWMFQLSVFGLPPSMCQYPPLLDRTAHQPLDLGTANSDWRRKYAADPEQFHFGSSQFSAEENIAYFLNANGSVTAMLRGGHKVWDWPSIEGFLNAELPRAESQFAEFETSMAAVRAVVATEKPKRKNKERRR